MPKPIENWITFPDRVLCESFLSIGFEHVWAPRSHFPIGLFFALFAPFSAYAWDRFGAILGGGARATPAFEIAGSSVRPAIPLEKFSRMLSIDFRGASAQLRAAPRSRDFPRNRQPLGAGKHAAEQG